jgi:hypothetical protein
MERRFADIATSVIHKNIDLPVMSGCCGSCGLDAFLFPQIEFKRKCPASKRFDLRLEFSQIIETPAGDHQIGP